MPFATLDSFAAPLQWAGFDAGNNPSAQLSISATTDHGHPLALTKTAMQIGFGSAATGHVLRRTLAAADLTGFDNLTLWVRSDGSIGTDPVAAFRLRLALGSAALPIGDPGNGWHRYLAVPQAGEWTYLQFALDDLPPAVRSALTTVEISVMAIGAPRSVLFDGFEAQARVMIGDAQAALLARLDGQLSLGGTPVPAVFDPDPDPSPVQPHFRLSLAKPVPAQQRALSAGIRTDHTDEGYRLRAEAEPWDLLYSIACAGADATDAATMQDFVIGRFRSHGWLPIGNRAWRATLVDPAQIAPQALDADARLWVRVSAWRETNAFTAVRPANDVSLGIGPLARVGETA